MAYTLTRWSTLEHLDLQEDSDSEDSDSQSEYHTPAEYVEELCLCPLCEDSEEEIWILYDDSNRNPGLIATIMPIAMAIWTFFWILDAYGLL